MEDKQPFQASTWQRVVCALLALGAGAAVLVAMLGGFSNALPDWVNILILAGSIYGGYLFSVIAVTGTRGSGPDRPAAPPVDMDSACPWALPCDKPRPFTLQKKP